MVYWIVNIAFSFLLCVILAGFLIPQILLISFRKRLFDEPDERKIHHSTVPRLGGLAFKPVIFLSVALLLGVNLAFGRTDMLSAFGDDICPLSFLFSSVILLYLVGMADDLVGVRYTAKFVVQLLCGVFLVAGGIWLDDFHGLLGVHALPLWAGYPLTLLVVVFIINSVNLIDGIDGLASGLCSCALLVYGVSFFLLGDYIFSLLSFSTLGVLVPFFYYNVYGNPKHHKKIFMGDTGALTVGMLLCFLSFRLAFCSDDGRLCAINPLVLSFSPLIIPCFDVLRVYLHRLRHGRSPFLPDRNHIHHKLLALGMRHRLVMFSIVSMSLFLTVCNLLLSLVVDVTLLLLLDLAAWTLANVWLSRRLVRRGG